MTYDPLDRILTTQTAATSGQDCWGLNFGDDALANLLSMSPSKCSGLNLSVSVSNNKISDSGFSYNADGDLTNDGLNSYAWNGAGELTSAAGVNYTYDGDGLRVEKSNGTLYWRSYTGQVIEETNTSGTMQRNYIFFAGRRIAWLNSSGSIDYYFADAIGSTRAVTNSTGSTCFSADYYPYGQENDYNTGCSVEFKFTGYEYDSESGNYYAMARYYSPRLGRFMSPDPLGGDVENPQSLNRYSYVLNNPENFIDPTGLTCWTEQNSVSAEIGVVCTTPSPSGLGGLKEAYFSFFSEATGMNGCVLGWCAPTPPSDTFAYGGWHSLSHVRFCLAAWHPGRASSSRPSVADGGAPVCFHWRAPCFGSGAGIRGRRILCDVGKGHAALLMRNRLERKRGCRHLKFITCCGYRRRPLLDSMPKRDLFLNILDEVRIRYRFLPVGFVVMREPGAPRQST